DGFADEITHVEQLGLSLYPNRLQPCDVTQFCRHLGNLPELSIHQAQGLLCGSRNRSQSPASQDVDIAASHRNGCTQFVRRDPDHGTVDCAAWSPLSDSPTGAFNDRQPAEGNDFKESQACDYRSPRHRLPVENAAWCANAHEIPPIRENS